jgi:hypothetical protein
LLADRFTKNKIELIDAGVHEVAKVYNFENP